MSWIPARHIQSAVNVSALSEINFYAHDLSTRGYLREFFEATLRHRADDKRISKHADAAELIEHFAAASNAEVFNLLRGANASLAAEDRRRNPPRTYGTEPWQQLGITGQYAEVAANICAYSELIVEFSGGLSELRAGREVVEAAIAVQAGDARRDYLSGDERATLTRLAAGDIDMLVKAYLLINEAIERLNLDQRVPFYPL